MSSQVLQSAIQLRPMCCIVGDDPGPQPDPCVWIWYNDDVHIWENDDVAIWLDCPPE